jgi:hypothetical protein
MPPIKKGLQLTMRLVDKKDALKKVLKEYCCLVYSEQDG